MTRDELLRLAESGNVDAMIAVAELYEKEGTVKSVYIAVEWYEKAAELENQYASLKAAANCITLARVFEDNDLDDEALNMWQRGYINAGGGILYANGDMSNHDIAIEMEEECAYGIAMQNYINRDLDSAMNILKTISNKNCIRANLLYAICLRDSINRVYTESEKDVMKAHIVTAFADGADYVTRAVVGNARHMEQLVFARATHLLSLLLDKETAHYVLTKAHQALTDESAIREIEEDLN